MPKRAPRLGLSRQPTPLVTGVARYGASMARYAVFVDAGFLLAAGGFATTGSPQRKDWVSDDIPLLAAVKGWAAEDCAGLELLRVYWFDAARDRQPSASQLAIAEQDDTKRRLGQLTPQGNQKGVDSLILSDLTSMARERSIVTAILLAGDADLVEAVSQAQHHGVRVIVWGVETPKNTMAPDLRREADRVRWLTAEQLAPFFSAVPKPVPLTPPPTMASTAASPVELTAPDTNRMAGPAADPSNDPPAFSVPPPSRPLTDELPLYESIDVLTALEIGREFADEWTRTVDGDEIEAVEAQEPRLPSDVDSQLIRFAMTRLAFPWSTRLARESLVAIREGFWAGLTER